MARQFRRSQVEKIKKSRAEVIRANDSKDATPEDRRKAHAVREALLRTSTPDEVDQGYEEHVSS